VYRYMLLYDVVCCQTVIGRLTDRQQGVEGVLHDS
jgi:hypothetical protein